jgi:hypothetical protein
MCQEGAAVLVVCMTFFLGGNVHGSTYFVLACFCFAFFSTKCCHFYQKASLFTLFFFFEGDFKGFSIFLFARKKKDFFANG